MCLLNVPYRPFPRVLSSLSAASSRPFSVYHIHCKNSPSAPARWSESGRMAASAPNTGYEPKLANFFSYMDPEHTPINIADNHHNFLCLDDVAMIPTSPEGLPNSEASSSSRQAAVGRVSSPSEFLVSGNRVHVMCRVVLATRKLEPSWWENLLRQRFLVHSRKGKEIETRCAFVERERTSPKHLSTERWFGRPRKERSSANIVSSWGWCEKLWKAKIPTLLLERSIKNLNLSDFSYIKQVHGQIRLRETKLTCMEIWNWEIGSSKKIMQGIAKNSKNWEKFVAKRLIKQSKQELKNCLLCNNTGILAIASQMVAQIRDLQNEVNSLSYAREFHDLESREQFWSDPRSRSNSTILSSRTLQRGDSGSPRNTQNCTGIMGNVFERPFDQEGWFSIIFNISKNLVVDLCRFKETRRAIIRSRLRSSVHMLSKKKKLRRDGHSKKVQNRYNVVDCNPTCFEFIFRFSIWARWRTSHQEIGAENPAKSKTKTEKRDAKKDADDPLANNLEWLTRVWRSSAKVTRNSPPLQVSQRSSRSNEVRELQTFLVELHSRGYYSRELRVEPTLWSKHQMCVSQNFACIVLATFSSCSWFHSRRSLLALHIARNPDWRILFGTDCFAEQFRKSKKSRACFFMIFSLKSSGWAADGIMDFLTPNRGHVLSVWRLQYIWNQVRFLSQRASWRGTCKYVVLFIALIGEKIFSGMKACICNDKYIFFQFSMNTVNGIQNYRFIVCFETTVETRSKMR